MPFRYDSNTNSIEMACGDTATMRINVQWNKLHEGDMLLFAVFDRETGTDVLCKPIDIVNGQANIRLCNHDTRDISIGRYRWNVRIITNPVIDADGNVRVQQCADDVITIFDNPPMFRLVKGGAYV